MKLTIDQMLQRIAYMVEEDLTKTNGAYSGDNLTLAQVFLDGINVALEKITREKGITKIAVISGVGVRDYYRHIGYRLENTYMVKKLKK